MSPVAAELSSSAAAEAKVLVKPVDDSSINTTRQQVRQQLLYVYLWGGGVPGSRKGAEGGGRGRGESMRGRGESVRKRGRGLLICLVCVGGGGGDAPVMGGAGAYDKTGKWCVHGEGHISPQYWSNPVMTQPSKQAWQHA